MPRLELFVKVYEDDDSVTTTENVDIPFEGYDLVDEVTNYIVNLLFQRATREDPPPT